MPGLGLQVACWVVAVAVGMGGLWRHALTPGPAAHARQDWPAEITFARPGVLPTLVMTVHPECPCSRASVNELAVLMARCDGKLAAYVLFAQTSGASGQIQSTALWKSAAQIPGVKVIADPAGVMTERFGGQTSGQVFLYDARGTLQFSGGLTVARGHEGDNDGLTAVESIVRSVIPVVRTTPVYGCKIW